jgi:DNA-binding NarL/FixJ family response regulator
VIVVFLAFVTSTEAFLKLMGVGMATAILVDATIVRMVRDYIFDALSAGASAFLLKRTKPEELIAGIHTVADGDSLLSPSVTRRVIDRMATEPSPVAVSERLDALTPRELEVLEHVAHGLSNREIAETFVIEESTVKTHVKRVLLKLGLRDRV